MCGGCCTSLTAPSVLDRKATSSVVDSLLDGVVDLESVVRNWPLINYHTI